MTQFRVSRMTLILQNGTIFLFCSLVTFTRKLCDQIGKSAASPFSDVWVSSRTFKKLAYLQNEINQRVTQPLLGIFLLPFYNIPHLFEIFGIFEISGKKTLSSVCPHTIVDGLSFSCYDLSLTLHSISLLSKFKAHLESSELRGSLLMPFHCFPIVYTYQQH